MPHVAHPAFLVLGAYGTYALVGLGMDPLVAGLLLMPVFFLFGLAVYQFYYMTFERRGSDLGVRGIAFFFGIAFIVQVGLILAFGVDQRMVEASYIGTSIEIFGDVRIPQRMIVAFGVALALTVSLALYLSRTFTGRAIKAVAQDEGALRLMGADPVRIKRWAFGIATGTCALAGRHGQHERHAGGGPDPRGRRIARAGLGGHLVGARSGVRDPPRGPRGPPGRVVWPMRKHR